jgi:FdhD protein
MSLNHPAISAVSIASVTDSVVTDEVDEVSVEEPLEIRVRVASEGKSIEKSIAVTMRTPGADAELAAGFLFTEGIVRHEREILRIRLRPPNVVLADLTSEALVAMSRLERQSYVSSSCGVCGKRSIAAVFTHRQFSLAAGKPRIRSQVVHQLANTLRSSQDAFNRTGGLHAAALFTTTGRLVSEYEDVGRHNALDKLIGTEFLAGRLPLCDAIILVSGRASFELIQKATMAGTPVLAAVGAPSSLAVALAREAGLTLFGFVRDGRFNVYSDSGRLADTVPQYVAMTPCKL